MNTIKTLLEKYVDSLYAVADPFNVGMSVHLVIFVINRFTLYLLLRGFSKWSRSDSWQKIHEYSGFISFILWYLVTVAFLWIKNN